MIKLVIAILGVSLVISLQQACDRPDTNISKAWVVMSLPLSPMAVCSVHKCLDCFFYTMKYFLVAGLY